MMLFRRLLILFGLFVLLQACTSKPDFTRELAKDDFFTLVQVKAGDTYASIAQSYLGDSKYSSIIRRYNPEIKLSQGNYVAIPESIFNPAGVFSNGYQEVPILCYHQFTKDRKGRTKMVVPEHEFIEQMEYLFKNGYTVIPLADVGQFIRGKKELPDKAIVITIDDGYRSYKDIALPILKKYGFPSTMFVYPDFVGAGIALKWRDVIDLNSEPLVDIQSHSKTHGSLSRKPEGETNEDYQKRLSVELVDAEQIIAKRTGNQINQFAYPYGNSSVELVEMLKENEYDLAVTVERGSNPAFSAPFLLNRTMVYGGDSMRTFEKSVQTFIAVDLK